MSMIVLKEMEFDSRRQKLSRYRTIPYKTAYRLDLVMKCKVVGTEAEDNLCGRIDRIYLGDEKVEQEEYHDDYEEPAPRLPYKD